MPETIDMDEIFILTAKLIYANLLRVLNDSSYPANELLRAAKPLFAVRFSRTVIFALDNYKLKVLMGRLKSSCLSAHWYQLLLRHMSEAMADDSVAIPFVFEEWRQLLVRPQLFTEKSFADWISILNNLVVYEVRAPADLATLPKADIFAITANWPDRELMLKLWQASDHSSTQDSSLLPTLSSPWATNASDFASTLRHRTINDTTIARSNIAAMCDIGLPSRFESAGPAAKIRILQYAKPDPTTLAHFLNAGSQLNILRQAQDSLRSVAAGVQ